MKPLNGANGEAFASAVQGAKGLGEDPVGASVSAYKTHKARLMASWPKKRFRIQITTMSEMYRV